MVHNYNNNYNNADDYTESFPLIISATSAFEFLEYFPIKLMGNSDSIIKHDNVATCSTCQQFSSYLRKCKR